MNAPIRMGTFGHHPMPIINIRASPFLDAVKMLRMSFINGFVGSMTMGLALKLKPQNRRPEDGQWLRFC
ncbi:hypothetical protein BLA17378_08627 [Burkholderia aenigmatica]|uniref:Uncharacterized protein n=1 Tax=Burkholderia aenigmatica TaxID=2015348 RepID=A0ABY6YA30_9BURK|nr:hypothetical protein BLA17378_08627 [Burkholderia aenigmatica]